MLRWVRIGIGDFGVFCGMVLELELELELEVWRCWLDMVRDGMSSRWLFPFVGLVYCRQCIMFCEMKWLVVICAFVSGVLD